MKHAYRRISSGIVVAAAVAALAGPPQVAAEAPAAAGPPPTAADQDLVVGAWVLDRARSTFNPGPGPAAETRTYQFEHEGLRARIVTSFADGQQSAVEYVASYNDVV